MIGAGLSFWYGYYKLCLIVVLIFTANFIYVFINFEKIAAD